jgi:hypothetical protein
MTQAIHRDETGSLRYDDPITPGNLELMLLLAGRLVVFAQPTQARASYSLLHRVTIYVSFWTVRRLYYNLTEPQNT